MGDNQSSYMKVLISLISALVTLLIITLPYNLWTESRARNNKVITLLAATYNEMRANTLSLQIDVNPVVSTTVLVTLIKDTDSYKVLPSSFLATLPRIYQRLVNIEQNISNKRSLHEARTYAIPEMKHILNSMNNQGKVLFSSKWDEMVTLSNGERIQIILTELEPITSRIGTKEEILKLREEVKLYEKACKIIDDLRVANLEPHQRDIEDLYKLVNENKLDHPEAKKEEMFKDLKQIKYVQIVPESKQWEKIEVINKQRRKENYNIWSKWLKKHIDTLEKRILNNTET